MEKEMEKLIAQLNQLIESAEIAVSNRSNEDAARFCALHFNRLLRRICDLEPRVAPLFTPLPEAASPVTTRLAARELVRYLFDNCGRLHGPRRADWIGSIDMDIDCSPVVICQY